MITGRWLLASTLALVMLPAVSGHAQTGNWPDKPIKVVVPFPPGGSADILGRLVADGLKNLLG